MAAVESVSSDSSNSVWWSSWITSAKEKSVSALNATKRDLAEFVSVVGADAKAAVKGASENINKILVSSEEKEESEDSQKKVVVEPPPETPYDRCKAELFTVQNSSETYLQDPNQGEEDEYRKWKSSFDIHSYQTDISNTLVSCSHVRTKHSQLVPAKVSYETFWMRYFYKMHRLEKEEKQRADLMARASKRTQEQLQWDEEIIDDVVSKPVVFKVEGSGHQRSESSTDSFVCVSEDTGLEAESIRSQSHTRDEPDTDSWEHLGSELGGSGSRNSRAKLSEMGEEEAASGGLVSQKEKQALLRSIELIVGTDADQDSNKEKEDSNSSEWEDWDD